jgi:hypothetical protein
MAVSSTVAVSPLGDDNMKVKVNGKKLKNKIEAVLLKGKWNYGINNKQDVLHTSIVMGVNPETNVLKIYNADPATYVENSMDCEEYEESNSGRFAIDSDIILKYLADETCVLSLEDTVLRISTERKTVKLPILERHQYNDNIIHTNTNVSWCRDIMKPVVVSSRTSLMTRIKVPTDELIEAFKDCESVGNSVYKLHFEDGDFTISSTKGNESVSITVECLGHNGPEATVEFSTPLHKHLNHAITIISFNDESPVSIMNGQFNVLRAPRIEG